jgi:hypothetical protein
MPSGIEEPSKKRPMDDGTTLGTSNEAGDDLDGPGAYSGSKRHCLTKGISFDKSKNAFVASVSRFHKQLKKSFSVEKYGDQAAVLAQQWRNNQISESEVRNYQETPSSSSSSI